MRSSLSILTLVCLIAAIHFQPSQSHLPPILRGRGLGKAATGRDAGGTALAAVISSRKIGLKLGLKAILFKPLLLVALAKIKLALLLGKPLALLAIKKLLLKAVLGKLLLKIPLILLKGKALLVKMLALKFALVTKGLLGLKAPLAMLFLGACALGSGLGLALALGATLHKLKEHDSFEEDYDEPSYALPPPRPVYGAPIYSAPAAPSYAPPAPSYAPAPTQHPAPYAQASGGGGGYGGEYAASQQGGGGYGVGGGGYGGRRKRDADSSAETGGEEDENDDSAEETEENSAEEEIDENPEDIQLEFEAARTNGDAYIYMAAQFDEQSCGRRLLCEVYQKPHETLTEDEILLQDIFGYPLPDLSEEDEGTPKEMYYRAAQLGASYQGRASNKICARFYPTCPHNAEQLINIFVSEDVQSNEIDTQTIPANHLHPPSSSPARLPFFVHHLQTPQTKLQSKPVQPQQQQQQQRLRQPAQQQFPQQQQQRKPIKNIRPPQIPRPTPATPVPTLRQRFVASPAA